MWLGACVLLWAVMGGCTSAYTPDDPGPSFVVPTLGSPPGPTLMDMTPRPSDMRVHADMTRPAPDTDDLTDMMILRVDMEVCPRVDLDGDGFDPEPGCGPVDCDDANATVFPGGEEVCDGLDNDCNGAPDDAIAEITCGVGACARKAACVNGIMPACEPGQPTQEVCDQQDNNCDGVVDNHGVVILHDVHIEELQVHSERCRADDPTFYPCQEGIDRFCAEQECTQSGFGPIFVDGQTFRIACVTDIERLEGTFNELYFRTTRPCRNTGELRNVGCLQAFHEWCVQEDFISGFGPIDVTDIRAYFGCLSRAAVPIERPFRDFEAAHENCNMSRRVDGGRVLACNQAIHRVCQNEGHISGYGPISVHQNNATATVVCLSD